MCKFFIALKAFIVSFLVSFGFYVLGINLLVLIDYVYIPVIILAFAVVINLLTLVYYYSRFQK